MRLPGIENAVVDPRKIRDYLLSPTHPLGRFRASLFLRLGYTLSNWSLLATDLRALAEQQEAELVERSPHGHKYVVRGIIVGPSGQAMEVVTVWIIMAGEAVPRLVTAIPGENE